MMNIALPSTWDIGDGAIIMIESTLGLAYLLPYKRVKTKSLFIVYYIFLLITYFKSILMLYLC